MKLKPLKKTIFYIETKKSINLQRLTIKSIVKITSKKYDYNTYIVALELNDMSWLGCKRTAHVFQKKATK